MNPQDRLKEYKEDIEKTQNAECQLLDIQRYSDREMTVAKIENRIKGYKQALEDTFSTLTDEFNKEYEDGYGGFDHDTCNYILQSTLTIPEEE